MPVAGPVYNNDDNQKFSADNVSLLFTNKLITMKWHILYSNYVTVLLKCFIYILIVLSRNT